MGSRNGNKSDEKMVKSGMKKQSKVTTDLNKNEVAESKNSEDEIVARRSMRGNKKEEKKEDTLPMRKPGPKRKASLKEKSKNASAVEEKSKPASVKRIKLTKEKDSKVSAE